MKYFVIIILFAVVFFLVGYFGMDIIHEKIIKDKVLSVSSEMDLPTPSSYPSITPSTTPTPTSTPVPPTPKPTITSTPTTTPITQPKVSSQEIHAFMERFAGQYGIDVNILRHIAVCESGFNPTAINGPYAGLYQFNSLTWKNNRILMGEDTDSDLRFNAEEAIQTAAYLMSLGKFYLWPNCIP